MFRTLAELIERPAGEVFIGFALMFLGAAFYFGRIPKSEDLIVAGFTLVSRAMMSNARPALPAGMVGTQTISTTQTAKSVSDIPAVETPDKTKEVPETGL